MYECSAYIGSSALGDFLDILDISDYLINYPVVGGNFN